MSATGKRVGVVLLTAFVLPGAVACSLAVRTIDEARAVDDAAPSAAQIVTEEVALVADGKVHRAPSIEAAITLATTLDPVPVHAYLAVGGQQPPWRWEAASSYVHPNWIGNEGLARLGVAVDLDVVNQKTTLRRDGRRAEFPFQEGRPLVRLRLQAATSARGFRDVDVLVASGFAGGLFLSWDETRALGLERSEIPGLAEVVVTAVGKSIACRRSLVTASVAELGGSALVPAASPLAPSSR